MDIVTTIQQRMKGHFPDLLGIQLTEASPEQIKATLTVRPELCTAGSILHGGAIMAFADTLGAIATVLNLPPGASTTTIESKTNFLSAAPVGTTVTGESTPLHRGKRLMTWQTKITSEAGKTVAVITQTQIVLEAQPTVQQAIGRFFEGKSIAEQKALLAELEHGGVAIYRGFAANETDEQMRAALLAAAEREEANARVLEGVSES